MLHDGGLPVERERALDISGLYVYVHIETQSYKLVHLHTQKHTYRYKDTLMQTQILMNIVTHTHALTHHLLTVSGPGGKGEEVGVRVDERQTQLADFDREVLDGVVQRPRVVVAVVVHVKVVRVTLFRHQTLRSE